MTKSLWDAIEVRSSAKDELDEKAEAVIRAYRRFQGRRAGTKIPNIGVLQFANGQGAYSFAPFLWPKEMLVKVAALPGGYGITVGWHAVTELYEWRVIVEMADGQKTLVTHEELKKADIPQHVMKLAETRIKAKCTSLHNKCTVMNDKCPILDALNGGCE